MARSQHHQRRLQTTLLQLVETVRDAATNEREAIAALVDWLERGSPRSYAPVPIIAVHGRRNAPRARWSRVERPE